jgi:hypothetical protein
LEAFVPRAREFHVVSVVLHQGGFAEIVEVAAILWKVSDRIGNPWDIDGGEKVEILRMAFRKGLNGGIAVLIEKLTPHSGQKSISVTDENSIGSGAQSVCGGALSLCDIEEFGLFQIVAQVLEVSSGIFRDTGGLEVVGEIFCERAFAGGFWSENADAFEVVSAYIGRNQVPVLKGIITDCGTADGHDSAIRINGNETRSKDFGELVTIVLGSKNDVRRAGCDLEKFVLPNIPKIRMFGGFLRENLIEMDDVTLREEFFHPAEAEITCDGLGGQSSNDDGKLFDKVACKISKVKVTIVRREKLAKKETVLRLIRHEVRWSLMRLKILIRSS